MKADREQVQNLLKTAKGQMDGIIRMVEDDRYCVDISNQIFAVLSILKKANREIIRAHIAGCVKEAFQSGQEEQKIDEIISMLENMSK